MDTLLLLADSGDSLGLAIRIPLSILNFLEFAIWGAWFVVLGNYLDNMKFTRGEIGRIYATMALGAVVSPMFLGAIADRYFATEQLMAVLHLAGAVLLYWMAQIRTPRLFFWVALLYASVYTPTLSLSNSLTFANIPETQIFGELRVMGTIGWIAAGLSLGAFIRKGMPVNNRPLLLAAGLSVVLGVYSLFLPHTPPTAAGDGGEAEPVMGVALELEDGGKGYTSPPKVNIAGGGGSGADAEATILLSPTEGKIHSIKVTKPGAEYTSIPTVTLSGGGGTGAKVKASLGIAAVKVTDPGKGYKVPPAITILGEGKDAALKPELDEDGSVKSIKVKNVGSGFKEAPKLIFPEAGIPFIKALGLFKETSAAVFFTVSFLITIALAFYYSFAALFLENGMRIPPQNVGPLMTIGQWVEIPFLLSLGWFISEFGMKAVLITGMTAWGLRYAIFASKPPMPILIIGIGLHGICFDFFFAAGMTHTANMASADIRSSAQSLFGMLTYGLGTYIGTEAAGLLNSKFTHETTDATGKTVRVTDWTRFWIVPTVGVAICLAAFLLLFN